MIIYMKTYIRIKMIFYMDDYLNSNKNFYMSSTMNMISPWPKQKYAGTDQNCSIINGVISYPVNITF